MSSECQCTMVSHWRTRLQMRDLEGASTPPFRPKSVIAGEMLASAANHLAHTGVSKAPPATIDRWQPIFKPRYDEVMVWYLLQDDVGAGISTSALIVRIFRPATGRHPVSAFPQSEDTDAGQRSKFPASEIVLSSCQNRAHALEMCEQRPPSGKV